MVTPYQLKNDILPERIAVDLLNIVERIQISKQIKNINHTTWHRFLDLTGRSAYLKAMGNRDHRNRWAESVFKIIEISKYSLLDMFSQRVKEHPDKVLFQDMSSTKPVKWSYKQIEDHMGFPV